MEGEKKQVGSAIVDVETKTTRTESDRPTIGSMIKSAIGSVGQEVKENMSILAPVRNRLQARRTYLGESSKWKHEKQIIAGKDVFNDIPPVLTIGEIDMKMVGGVGKITYVQYLKDDNTGGSMRDPAGGGYIITHYVEETIENGKPIHKEATEVNGHMNYKDAKKKWDDKYESERSRTNFSRGN